MATRTDGIVLRPAEQADRDQLAVLIEERMGEEDLAEALAAFDDDGGAHRYFIAVDSGRVVSMLSLWEERVRVGDVWLPAGQLDFVATTKGYERRGLVRDLIGMAHEVSEQRRDVLQVLVGIPYFYRQFGYTYVLPMPSTYTIPAGQVIQPVHSGIRVRTATRADLPALQGLQDHAQAYADIAMPHSPQAWRWLSDASSVELRIVEDGGTPIGMARTQPGEESPAELAEVAALNVAAVRALVAEAQGEAARREVRVVDRPGIAVSAALAGHAVLQPNSEEIMLRVTDPVRLLAALTPVLSGRLARAGYPSESGELLISLYRSSVVMSYSAGVVTGVRDGPGMQAPVAAGGAGVPPDLFADLVFGPHGAEGLASAHSDCFLGRVRGLMAALFPPQRADVLTYYLV